MKRKITLLISIVMILSLVLSACGGGSSSSSTPAASGGEASSEAPAASTSDDEEGSSVAGSGDIVLSFMHRYPDEPFKSFLEGALDEFIQNNPDISIAQTYTATDPYAEKLQILMASQDAPDVFFGFPGDYLWRFVREDMVMDLTDAYNARGWDDVFNYALMEQYVYDGGLYGLDYSLTVKLFFYNIDIFNEYGLEAPETWEQLIEVCKVLDENGVLPIAEGDADQWPATHLLSILFHVMVPEEVRAQDYEPTTGEWTDPSYIAALDKYSELLEYMNDDVVALRHSDARMLFANGQSAMAWLECIEIENVDQDALTELNYGMFKFPYIEGAPGNQNMLLGSPEGFSVSSRTAHPEESLDLLEWVCGPEVGARMPGEIQWFNASKDSFDRNGASQKLVDVYDLLMETEGLVNWIDNECHTLLRDVFYARSQDFLTGDLNAEQYMELVRAAAAEAKIEMTAN